MAALDEKQLASYSRFDDVLMDAPDQAARPSRHPSPLHLEEEQQFQQQQEEQEQRKRSKGCCGAFKQMACAPSSLGQKIMCGAFWTVVAGASIVLFAVVFPRFVEKAVQPFVRLLTQRLTKPQIAGVIFAAVAIIPFSLIISVLPFVWLAGIVFTFPVAMCIVMAGSFVGMSLQYWAARYALHDRIVRRIEKNRKGSLAVMLRAVELVGPVKVVALLRLGPFPYHWVNYALGVCPSIRYPLAISVSFVCELLPRSLHVFFGKSLETLADLLRGKVHNVGVAVYNVAVLLIGIGFIILTVIMSKRALRKVEELERQKEEEDAAQAAAAEAAEAGTAADGSTSCGTGGALPDKIQSKFAGIASTTPAAANAAAGGGGVGSSSGAGSSSEGDIQVLVADSAAAADDSSSSSARNFNRSSSSVSSFIGVGQQPPAAAAAAGGLDGAVMSRSGSNASSVMSFGSRLSSVSSLRALLGGKPTSSFSG